jgi:hypothetical protein
MAILLVPISISPAANGFPRQSNKDVMLGLNCTYDKIHANELEKHV